MKKITKLQPGSLSVLSFNSFKDDTPLPCKLAAINDDGLTVHVMNDMVVPFTKNISSVAIELAEDMALFAAAVASNLKDSTAEKNFREISDMISSIRTTDEDGIFMKIQNQVEPFNASKKYTNFAQQILTILHTGYNF